MACIRWSRCRRIELWDRLSLSFSLSLNVCYLENTNEIRSSDGIARQCDLCVRMNTTFKTNTRISGKYMIVQKMMRCSSLKQSALRPSLGYYIVKEREKNRINERKREKRRREKKTKGDRIGKKRKGKEKVSNYISFSSLFLCFCRGPWREKWKTRNERQRQRLGKRATALFARLPNWFREETSEIINRLSSKNYNNIII